MRKHYLLSLLLLFVVLTGYASRNDILLNTGWKFRFAHQVSGPGIDVVVPHTWNTRDALIGKMDYKRGIGNYDRTLFIRPEWQGKRLFLRFEGVNTVANLFINGKNVGEHRGGYAAFIFEITDKVEYGKDNKIMVRVNNAEQLDIMPLLGDFNMYGGIYRDVHLMITDELCISPLDYASSGVYLVQESVTDKEAKVKAKVVLSNGSKSAENAEVVIQIWDGSKLVKKESRTVNLASLSQQTTEIDIQLANPHLWNGIADPFIYKAEVTLLKDGKEIDKVTQPLGLRYYTVDADKGFILNGKHVQLRGVCRHQDRANIGNALYREHHDEDMALMKEMGINATRLAHYHQAEYIYDLMDKNGFLVWAEIPFIGPGGYHDTGFVDQESFKENGFMQLKELIRQNYNHPSIITWGLFNELRMTGDNPVEYIKELNDLAHKEDPTRPTTAASNINAPLNFITDLIAWNRYDGWYGSTPKTLGTFLDRTHKEYPQIKIGVSEYGAGASIYHQQDSLKQTSPTSFWHPENWQTYYHVENWKIINERPFVWGTFVWNMFDFGAAHRTEGDRYGVNDKGLVTFDRKHKKDSFFFYKANWNKDEKTLYISERRHINRTADVTTVTVFTNAAEAELFVNGQSYGKKKPDNYAIIKWDDVKLKKGANNIEVRAADKKVLLTDSCVWNVLD